MFQKLLLLFFLLLPSCLRAETLLEQEDKKLHFAVSAILAWQFNVMAHQAYESNQDAFKVSMLSTLAVGLAKELIDESERNNEFSWKDMEANFLGALSMNILLINFEF